MLAPVEGISMKGLRMLWLSPALCLVAALCLADAPSSERDRGTREIEDLIRQLGDDSFEKRAAARLLMERDDAAPALRKALKSADPEVKRWANEILEELARREDRRELGRLADFAKRGEIDLAAELLVRRAQWRDEEAAWQLMTGLAAHLIERTEKDLGKLAIPPRDRKWPVGDFRQYLMREKPKIQSTGRIVHDEQSGVGPVVARADDIQFVGPISGDLLVSAGPVRGLEMSKYGPPMLIGSVVFACGPVTVGGSLARSVVICDGDVTVLDGGCSTCLIIARGDIICRDLGARESRIIASGKVRLPKVANNRGAIIKENEPDLLGFVKFFDPARAGIEVEAAEGGVRVKQATEGKPFARAGLRAGDLVTELGGAPTTSPDMFRRLLRTRIALGDEMVFKVRRGEKTLEVRARDKD
jgi:hypothetical protein